MTDDEKAEALTLASNQELIDELLSRSTFAGMIYYIPGSAKLGVGEERFISGGASCSWRNMDRENAMQNCLHMRAMIEATPEEPA